MKSDAASRAQPGQTVSKIISSSARSSIMQSARNKPQSSRPQWPTAAAEAAALQLESWENKKNQKKGKAFIGFSLGLIECVV